MTDSKFSLRCVNFDWTKFDELIASVCPGLALEEKGIDQVHYLASYLRHPSLAVGTLVLEQPYVDRHYIEEYSRYYATSFRPPASKTTRIHVFGERLDDQNLFGIFREAIDASAVSKARARLQGSYRGFFVVRPLPSAPIGRTILQTYDDSVSRVFGTTRLHRVHLCGVELTVSAVPFQQQEVAVGACATTAVWSALASVARATGARGPTPYQITEAATRHLLNDRPFPAQAGLDLQQVISAVHGAGFAPQTLKAAGIYETFSVAVKCYLASGIPVVLIVEEDGGYHAVAAVGYRSSDEHHGAANLVVQEQTIPLATTGLSRVYVHDDRLGPYARMSWEPPEPDSGLPRLRHIKESGARYDFGTEPMKVYAAVAPLYPKIRLSARGLLKVAAEIYPLVRYVSGEARDELRIEMRFMLGGDYLAELCELGADTERVLEFVTGNALPRYVGVVRYIVGAGAVGDVVCDSTDIFRASPKYGSILALIPLVESAVSEFVKYAAKLLHAVDSRP